MPAQAMHRHVHTPFAAPAGLVLSLALYTIIGARNLALPGLPPGVYQIRIGVYNTHTGARRRIHDPLNDAAGDSLMLDTFEIP